MFAILKNQMFTGEVQECIRWMRKLIFYISGVNFESMLNVLMFDIQKIEKRNVNSLCIIISSYIACVQFNRKNLNNIVYCFKAKIIKDQRLNMKLLGEKANKVFSDNYCKLDYKILNEL